MRLLASLIRFLIVLLKKNSLDTRGVKTLLLKEKHLRIYMPSNRGDVLQVQNILNNLPEKYKIKLYINSIQRPYIFENGFELKVIESWYTTSPYLFSFKGFLNRKKKIDPGFTIALKPSIEMLARPDVHYISLIEFENLVFSIINYIPIENHYTSRLKYNKFSGGRVLVAPSASWKFRKLDNYINIIETQLKNKGKRVSFLLSKSEFLRYQEQVLSADGVYFFEDFESKEQWNTFLSNFEYTITPDSIVLHLCNYFKKPVVCIFGPSKFVWNQNFFFDGVNFIESNNKCSPCRQLFCYRIIKRGSCLADSIDRVILK